MNHTQWQSEDYPSDARILQYRPINQPVTIYSVQFSRSALSDSLRPHGLQHAKLPVHHQLREPAQTHVHWVSDAIQPSHPLSSPSPAFNLSQHQGLFQWVSSSYKVTKYWSLSFSISPFNKYPGLISFRFDWFDLLAVQRSLKSLLQHYSSKPLILWGSAFFMDQISYPYMTIWKTISLTKGPLSIKQCLCFLMWYLGLS